LFVAAFEDEHLQDEIWYLQVQAGMECEKTVLQGVMEDKELEMEGGGCSGQFGCRKEEGRGTEIEAKMEEPEWMEGMEASDEYQPAMEDFDESRCVLGTLVGVLSDQG